MNQVNIIGRLGADVDLRYTTTTQRAVARMSVAVNDRYGENERVYWFSVICWNGLAETVSAYLHKGSRIAVTGRLITRSFETSITTTSSPPRPRPPGDARRDIAPTTWQPPSPE